MSKESQDDGKPEGWESFAEAADEGALEPSEQLEVSLHEAELAEEQSAEAAHARPTPGEELERAREQLLRLTADFDNFRKRVQKERVDALQYGHEHLARDLLSCIDNLERAVEHIREGDPGIRDGVGLVLHGLLEILAKHGVTEIEAQGVVFDPTVHEAVSQAQDDSLPPNSVVEVLQKGYRLRERLLRAARVVVSQRPASDDEAPTEHRE